jgi:von Willebrand factor A domain-containing protein 7
MQKHRMTFAAAAAMLSICAMVAPQAQQQRSNARAGWPCVGRPDPSYVEIAEASGGQVFLLDPSEIGGSAPLLMARERHAETIDRRAGDLEDGTHEFTVPVDRTVASLLFSISLQCMQAVEIARPDGSLVQASQPDIDWHAFQAVRVVTIESPDAGDYRIRVAGRGVFFMLTQARTEVALENARFVRQGGRPGHEGLFTDDTPLRPGTRRQLEIDLSEGWTPARMIMLSSEGEDLGAAELTPAGEDAFLASVIVPARRFRVAVLAGDTAGGRVQRVHEPLFMVAN